MNAELFSNTAVCAEYERLLFLCEYALNAWRERREEVSDSGLRGEEVAGELLRLQASYARAYSHLERHEDHCDTCRFVSKIGGRNHARVSHIALDRKRIA